MLDNCEWNHKSSKSYIWQERGVVAGGYCGSVAERWLLKPGALGLTPSSSSFLLSPFAISKVYTSSSDWDCVFDLTCKHYWPSDHRKLESRPSNSFPRCDFAHDYSTSVFILCVYVDTYRASLTQKTSHSFVVLSSFLSSHLLQALTNPSYFSVNRTDLTGTLYTSADTFICYKESCC